MEKKQARQAMDPDVLERRGRSHAGRRKAKRPAGRALKFREIAPILPLMAAIGIVPLIVFLKVTPVPPAYRQFWVTDYDFDFFSYYKAQLILACAGLVLAAILVLAWRRELPRKKNILYIPLGVYTVMLVASTLASRDPTIALGGYFDRAEGMWVLLAYVALLVGTSLLVSDARQAGLILAVWAAALCLISILGIFQFFGLDFFSSPFGRLLIVPVQDRQIAPLLTFNFPIHSIYATLYNPDNVASMLALAFPVAAAGFILARTLKRQVAFGVLAGLLCLTLVGANGRAGWIAALLAVLLLVWLSMRKGVPGWWMRAGILALVVLLEFGSLNYFSGSALSSKVGGLVAETGKALESGTGRKNAKAAPTRPGTIAGAAQLPPAGIAEQLIRKYGRLGTGRGYIWIRSLQMAGKTVLLGGGPDTFALYFPHNDPYLDKSFFGQAGVFIDKPHNMYLQLWLNLGGLATLAFLALLVLHAVRTLRVLKRADLAGMPGMLAAGLFAGWAGYLLAAFFYDSVVSVAAAFWIVFGLGMAMNDMLEQAGNREAN
ncbi:MAG: O-antigen ligase family protein [Anaerolineales bacterium]